ncbi:MAG: universal stress protein [Desulfobacterales bacterium]|nr:universal stress protein [Desulfobacterales bacterium]
MPTLPDYKTILYATDLGEHTKPVFRSALSLAIKYDATIIMLHVVEPMSSAMQAVVDTYLTEIDAKKIYRDNLQAVLDTMKQRLKDFCRAELNSHELKSSHVDEMFVVSGRPSEEIIKIAEKHQADLIVLGKSSRSVLGSDVSGSTSRRVSRYSTTPVLVVPNQ